MRNYDQDPFSKLLIVDDDPSILFSMESVLDEIGYSVRSADNGLSALAEIEKENPDILLSDLNLPRMSGFELLQVVRRHFPSIHLVAMSGAFSGNEVPSGVCAEAFYQKGSGIRSLLIIIDRLARFGPRPVYASAVSALIWILRSKCDASEEPCVSIDCPYCHRTFQQLVGGCLSLVREAHCPHCRNTGYYAIVEPVEREPELSSRRFDREAMSDYGALSIRNLRSL
jgi:CheY-like chemotaxis protein